MSDTTILICVFALIGLVIVYFIIKAAVSSAISKKLDNIFHQVKYSNILKVIELKKSGITEDEINTAITKAFS